MNVPLLRGTPGESELSRLVGSLLVCSVLFMRVQLPGNVPLVLVITVVLVSRAVARGVLRLHPGRLEAVAVGLGVVGLVGLVGLVRSPAGTSASSLAYLIAIYAPFALAPALQGGGRSWPDIGPGLDRFERLLLVLAGVSIGQLLLQLAGFPFLDLVGDAIPSGFRVTGFISSYPLSYGSSLYKSNGLFFLEASFCSQFLALGLLLRLVRGRAGWPVPVLILGILATAAGTGIILAAVGLLVLTLGRRPAVVRILAGPGIAALAGGALTPLGTTIVDRLSEGGSKNSSTSLRFIQPFSVLGRLWTHDLDSLLLGRGPGFSQRAAAVIVGRDVALQVPVPLKLVVDYGGPAAAIFLLSIVWSLLRDTRWPALTAGLVVSWLFLSSALLQPATDIPLWVLCVLTSRPPTRPEMSQSVSLLRDAESVPRSRDPVIPDRSPHSP